MRVYLYCKREESKGHRLTHSNCLREELYTQKVTKFSFILAGKTENKTYT